MNVVVRTADGAVGMLVDEIGDVIEVMPEAIESPPETLSVAARAFVDGVCKLPTRLLLVLAIRHVVTMGPVESQSR